MHVQYIVCMIVWENSILVFKFYRNWGIPLQKRRECSILWWIYFYHYHRGMGSFDHPGFFSLIPAKVLFEGEIDCKFLNCPIFV